MEDDDDLPVPNKLVRLNRHERDAPNNEYTLNMNRLPQQMNPNELLKAAESIPEDLQDKIFATLMKKRFPGAMSEKPFTVQGLAEAIN